VEFPDLIAVYRMYRGRGLELATVSADPPEKSAPVLAFLEGAARLGTEPHLREAGPVRADRSRRSEVAGRAAAHDRGRAGRPRVVYRSDGGVRPARAAQGDRRVLRPVLPLGGGPVGTAS
jgi:hypothetical protein